MSVASLRDLVLRSVVMPPQAPCLRISMAGTECERAMYYAATGAPRDPVFGGLKVQRALDGTTCACGFEIPPGGMITVGSERQWACTPECFSLRYAVRKAIGTGFDRFVLDREREGVGSDGTWWRFQIAVNIPMDGWVLSGTADAVLFRDASNPIPCRVGDLKTVASKTWRQSKAEAKPEHVSQVTLYCHGLGSPEWEVCYANANTGEVKQHNGAYNAELAQALLAKFDRVHSKVRLNVVPDRVYDSPEGWPCEWCDFRSHCWQDALSEALNDW